MAYITNADIQERLGNAAYVQLTDDDGNGSADVGVVDEARLGAEGELNSYLARRYVVPIDLTVHAELADVLATFTLDLAEYRLRSRRPPVGTDAVNNHARAIAWLKSVANGAIDLPSIATIATSTLRGTTGVAKGRPRRLTDDEMASF